MKDLAERLLSDLYKIKSPTRESMGPLLLKYLTIARDDGITSNNLFHYRRFRKRYLSCKMEEDRLFREFIEGLEDMVATNAEIWKKISNKYKYFYKDVD